MKKMCKKYIQTCIYINKSAQHKNEVKKRDLYLNLRVLGKLGEDRWGGEGLNEKRISQTPSEGLEKGRGNSRKWGGKGAYIEMVKRSSARAPSKHLCAGLYKLDHGQPGNLGTWPAELNRTQDQIKLLGVRALAKHFYVQGKKWEKF